MTKTEFAKAIVGFVIGSATAKVAKQIVMNNVSPDSVTDKAAVIIGTYVIGAIVGNAARKWSDAEIDKAIAYAMKFVKERQTETV